MARHFAEEWPSLDTGLLEPCLERADGARRGVGAERDTDHPTLSLLVRLSGDYAIALVLSPEGVGPSQVLQAPFRIAEVATTGGAAPGIPADFYLSHAMIRFSTESEFGEKREAGDHFYMTIPTDLHAVESTVRFLWYHEGQYQGQFTRRLHPGAVAVDRPLEVPVRVWGWPAEFNKAQLYAQAGAWEVQVIRNGGYLTTCAIQVEKGAIKAPGTFGRLLDCGTKSGPTVQDAVRRSAGDHANMGPSLRALEVTALHVSPEVREARKQLDANGGATAFVAGKQLEANQRVQTARSAGSRSLAEADKAEADAQRSGLSKDTQELRARYEKLVRKYGHGK